MAKGILISTLDARLHTGELRFAAELTEAGAMSDELKDFRRKVGVAGRYSYEARVGERDDLVLAVAIALWRAARPRDGELDQRAAAVLKTGYDKSRGLPEPIAA